MRASNRLSDLLYNIGLPAQEDASCWEGLTGESSLQFAVIEEMAPWQVAKDSITSSCSHLAFKCFSARLVMFC